MAWCRLLALLALSSPVSCGSWNPGNEDRCPCLKKHDVWSKDRLAHYAQKHPTGPDYSKFGIGCTTHPIDLNFAKELYGDDHGARLTCANSTQSPWCVSKWCYVNVSTCNLHWEFGAFGPPFSYATCSNLRNGTAEYLLNSMASYLGNDSLRIFHVENTLKGGYLGNTYCDPSGEIYDVHQRCDGKMAQFWNRALKSLSAVKVGIDHSVILKDDKDSPSFDQWIRQAFDSYFRDVQTRRNWVGKGTNFDLCAFATATGYVDLCVGKFTLTQERQRITNLIPMYTSAVYLISTSKCDFFATSDSTSWQFWLWWLQIFSWQAWLFFAGVVFLFVFLMKCVDSWQELQESQRCNGCSCKCWKWTWEDLKKFGRTFWDFCLGVFEAFTYKQKTYHSLKQKDLKYSRASYMLRLGLNFFLLLTTTIYGSNITAKLISAKEAKVEYGSLGDLEYKAEHPETYADGKIHRIHLCVHQIMLEFVEPQRKKDSKLELKLFTDYEDVDDLLTNKTCEAALLEEEVWNSLRQRGHLCGFAKESTPIFYMPTGSVVSRRAHRTLEAYRFSPLEASFFGNKSHIADLCPKASAYHLCNEKEGVPWFTFVSLSVMAFSCAALGMVHHLCKSCLGQDENDEKPDPPPAPKPQLAPSLPGPIDDEIERMEDGRLRPSGSLIPPRPSPRKRSTATSPSMSGDAVASPSVSAPPGTDERRPTMLTLPGEGRPDLELRKSPTAKSPSSAAATVASSPNSGVRITTSQVIPATGYVCYPDRCRKSE